MKKYIVLIFLVLSSVSCKQHKSNQPISQIDQAESASHLQYDVSPIGQLPKHWQPTHYQLDLTINPDLAEFFGQVSIDLQINQPRNHYYFHGNLLTVSKTVLLDSKGKEHIGKYEQVDQSGVVRLSFDEVIPVGKARVTVQYSAAFNEALEGLYRVTDDGLNYAFTQFEAVSARLAFPGFDEPAFKVPFDVSITAPANMHTVANTRLVKTNLSQERQDYVKSVFATSEPLPTYLLAFAVGEFDIVEWPDLPATAVRDHTVPLRGIATKGKGTDFEYALQHTQEILEILEEYFQIPYPYDKLDLIAVPDFTFGAMENAGAITYREQYLLLGENPSVSQIKSFSSIHAHELGHQWFGNYVTPYWWNDIWLNEAFATWITYTTLQKLYPNIGYEESILKRAVYAMRNDSLRSARQIRQPIASNHDIDSAFDGITYSKGAAVLDMMNHFIGPEDFQEGLQNYMQKHAWKNAHVDDFIAAIAEKSKNLPFDQIKSSFNSFLEQNGIPMLNVALSCKQGVNVVAVRQSRYLPAGSEGQRNRMWEVPACFTYTVKDEQQRYCRLIDESSMEFDLPGVGCAAYVMPNADGSGYYRFNTEDDWKTFYDHSDDFTTKEMMSINDSFFAALDADQINLIDFFAIAPQLIEFDEKDIIEAPMSIIKYLDDRIVADTDKILLQKTAKELYQGVLTQVLEREQLSELEVELKRNLISFMAQTVEDSQWQASLIAIAKKYTGFQGSKRINEEGVDVNLIGTAMEVAGENLGKGFHEHVKSLLKMTTDGIRRDYLLSAISTTKDPELLTALRNWSLTDDVRNNEMFSVLWPQIYDSEVQDDLWHWAQDNINGIKSRLSTSVQGRLPVFGKGFCTAEKRDELKAFFEPIVESLSGGPRYLAQTIESIDQCIVKKARLAQQWDDWKATMTL